jgi:hypothetical protein
MWISRSAPFLLFDEEQPNPVRLASSKATAMQIFIAPFLPQDSPGFMSCVSRFPLYCPHLIEQILAESVLSCDVAEDGRIVYSNGSVIYQIDSATSKPREICRGRKIEQVRWV